MSAPSTLTPRVAVDLGPAQRRRALAAYAAVLIVFFAIFGHGTLTWPPLLAYFYGLVPISWPRAVYQLTQWGDLGGPVLAWTAALVIAVVLISRRPTARPAAVRAGAIAAAAVLAAPGLWVVLNRDTVASNDLWWRIIEAFGAFGLIAAWCAARRGPGLAELGIERHPERQPRAVFHQMRLSLIGFCLASIGAAVLAVLLPLRVADNVGVGQNEPWWLWVLVFTLNAAIEESICTAWLYAQARRAGRPMWEVYTAAAVMRAPFHLYMGIGGLCAAVFATFNIAAFHRTRRLIPLILVHAGFDLVAYFGTQRLAGLPLAALAFLAFLVILVVPVPGKIRSMWRKRVRRDYTDFDPQVLTSAGMGLTAPLPTVTSQVPATIPGQRDGWNGTGPMGHEPKVSPADSPSTD